MAQESRLRSVTTFSTESRLIGMPPIKLQHGKGRMHAPGWCCGLSFSVTLRAQPKTVCKLVSSFMRRAHLILSTIVPPYYNHVFFKNVNVVQVRLKVA